MKIHPIIYALDKTTDNIQSIVVKYSNKSHPLESVFLKLIGQLDSNRKELNQPLLQEIDQAILKGHTDSDVYLLFIYHSISYYSSHGWKSDKIKALYSIGTSILSENNHPLIKALWANLKAFARFLDISNEERIKLLQETLTKIGQNHPRYELFLNNFSTMLATNGTLKDLENKDLKTLNVFKNESQAYVSTRIQLVNTIIIGDYMAGFNLIKRFQEKFSSKLDRVLSMAYAELNLLSGNFNVYVYEEENYTILLKVFTNLIDSKFDEAAIAYQWLEKNNWSCFNGKFFDYLPFHIELCKRNKGAIRLLLKEKEEKKATHYFDDLFYGRLYLLEKNYAMADESFFRLIKNIHNYGALNRLVFELQFAKEMKLSDILLLTQGWKKTTSNEATISITPKNLSQNIVVKGLDLLVGNSPSIKKVKELIIKFTPLKSPVLITGETGTGKELVARAIHEESSFVHEPFLAINCGALTESLLQSELYGYVAGAFTGAQKERKGIFEAAGKGTVFLDEFGDISPQMQVSLLRLLESNEIRMLGGTINRKIECRIIVATNVNLQGAVKEKKFREDLYYRLTKLEIHLPTLRERMEDLPLLMNHFLNSANDIITKPKIVSIDLLEALSAYHWPGNIRELKNEMDRLNILHAEKELLLLSDFDFHHLQESINKPIVDKRPNLNVELDHKKMLGNKRHSELSVTHENIVKIIQRKSKAEQRHSFIKDLFKQYKKLKRSQIVEIANISAPTATKELQKLCDEGFIVRYTPTSSPSTFYFEIAK
jgi:transcriptional regulator with PAS, ATPase and Fis domain